jgi:hypothetical protein
MKGDARSHALHRLGQGKREAFRRVVPHLVRLQGLARDAGALGCLVVAQECAAAGIEGFDRFTGIIAWNGHDGFLFKAPTTTMCSCGPCGELTVVLNNTIVKVWVL